MRLAELAECQRPAAAIATPCRFDQQEVDGGTVELESKKSKGTTVTLTIPRGSR